MISYGMPSPFVKQILYNWAAQNRIIPPRLEGINDSCIRGQFTIAMVKRGRRKESWILNSEIEWGNKYNQWSVIGWRGTTIQEQIQFDEATVELCLAVVEPGKRSS